MNPPLLPPYARCRMIQRSVSEEEALATLRHWDQLETGENGLVFRKDFAFSGPGRGKRYFNKQVEVLAVHDKEMLVAVTLCARLF